MGKTTSQDQCASSDSVHDESYRKYAHDMRAALFLQNPELSMNIVTQPEMSQPTVQFPYACADPYISGFYTAYGPHNMIQPQVMAAATGRIPLPADIPEDGPIYVNAKQYHGILRRRQIRAKLEAQNKLVKNRKPYLHESRHQHAVNRVRGSGGRFLSTRKAHEEQPGSEPNNPPSSFLFGKKMDVSNCNVGPSSTGEDTESVRMTVQTQGGGFAYYASVVR
ncbi:Nuclear transcription factor Y subunit A-6 [Striga hermonthica]|uniref:Nuclear transcription factor Y subunit n=1 Tax=Striga hermonthica TaxID=68872 RepID=A0A9N7NQI3_STRHE|nr:Nuclear transcription factor Y subunit A-6 [Striga hermonthica]